MHRSVGPSESPYRKPAPRLGESVEDDHTLDERLVTVLTVAFLAPLEVVAGRADRWGTAAVFICLVLAAALFILGSLRAKR